MHYIVLFRRAPRSLPLATFWKFVDESLVFFFETGPLADLDRRIRTIGHTPLVYVPLCPLCVYNQISVVVRRLCRCICSFRHCWFSGEHGDHCHALYIIRIVGELFGPLRFFLPIAWLVANVQRTKIQ